MIFEHLTEENRRLVGEICEHVAIHLVHVTDALSVENLDEAEDQYLRAVEELGRFNASLQQLVLESNPLLQALVDRLKQYVEINLN